MRNPRMPADLSAYPERQGFVTKVSLPQLQPKTSLPEHDGQAFPLVHRQEPHRSPYVRPPRAPG